VLVLLVELLFELFGEVWFIGVVLGAVVLPGVVVDCELLFGGVLSGAVLSGVALFGLVVLGVVDDGFDWVELSGGVVVDDGLAGLAGVEL